MVCECQRVYYRLATLITPWVSYTPYISIYNGLHNIGNYIVWMMTAKLQFNNMINSCFINIYIYTTNHLWMTHLNGNKIVKGKKACNLWVHAPGMPGAHCSDPEQKKLQRPKQAYEKNLFSPPPPFSASI